uniref:Uncharacterized protein n=1 Tax=Anguilla anguilla TaxID=7936 RepID=A0A0E9TSE7_ANGAN
MRLNAVQLLIYKLLRGFKTQPLEYQVRPVP